MMLERDSILYQILQFKSLMRVVVGSDGISIFS